MDVKLVLLKNKGGHKSFPLMGGVTVLGRRRDCDLRIPLKSVSRRHCQINLDNGSIKVRDLNSMNGTEVNGETVDEAVIKAGDNIKVGPLSFIL
ncbi:MAG: FHA domain-containing protein, partial [Planctomycetota bacterium]